MPIDQAKLDELTTLLVDQMLFEFRTAATEKKALDPRRLAAAQKLLEAADARSIKPAEPVAVPRRHTGKSDEASVESPPKASHPTDRFVGMATPKGRRNLRLLNDGYLSPEMRAELNEWAEEDGVDLLPDIPEREKPK